MVWDSSSTSSGLSSEELTQLHRDGFLAVPQFVQPADIAEVSDHMQKLYEEHNPDSGILVHCCRLQPKLKRTNVFRRCRAIARQVLGLATFHSFDSLIYKPPRGSIGTRWHQDQVYDRLCRDSPELMRTLHFWIPLQSVSEANGCLQYIPRTHSHILPHRALQGNHRFLALDEVNTQTAVLCPLNVGGATMHFPNTVHCAGPNTTESPRRAWTLHFWRLELRDGRRILAQASAWVRSAQCYIPPVPIASQRPSEVTPNDSPTPAH